MEEEKKQKELPITQIETSNLDDIIIIKSTNTPPAQCESDSFYGVLMSLPEGRFSASSEADGTSAENAKLWDMNIFARNSFSTDADAWVPSTNDLNQFIQVDLIEMIPVYGLEVEGSSHLASYTTSLSVLYSLDGSIFSPIYDNTNHEKVFR